MLVPYSPSVTILRKLKIKNGDLIFPHSFSVIHEKVNTSAKSIAGRGIYLKETELSRSSRISPPGFPPSKYLVKLREQLENLSSFSINPCHPTGGFSFTLTTTWYRHSTKKKQSICRTENMD